MGFPRVSALEYYPPRKTVLSYGSLIGWCEYRELWAKTPEVVGEA